MVSNKNIYFTTACRALHTRLNLQ